MNRYRYDSVLLLFPVMITLLGIITLFPFGEVISGFALRQSIFLLIGIACMTTIPLMSMDVFYNKRIVTMLYGLIVSILVLVLLIGSRINGAKSWFDLGFVSLQPSDFAKVILVIMLAYYFAKRHVHIGSWKHIIITGILFGILFGLVVLQPDFGTAIIMLSIWFGILLFSGLSRYQLGLFVVLGCIASGILWSFVFEPYQKQRIVSFLDPLRDRQGSGYNAYQSVVAVGSGQIVGKGIGYGTQSRLQFLPEHETDFIFASFTEEWGFLGSVFLVTLYTCIFYRLLVIAQRVQSNFSKIVVFGAFTLFFSHFVINVGMNIGLMPITGITLPFMSYGGSHIVATYIMLGIVQSIYRHEYR